MTFRLGVECSDIFAAIAPVSRSIWLENPWLKEPVTLLYITGDSDPLNPLNGGKLKIGKRSFGNKKPISEILTPRINLLVASNQTVKSDSTISTIRYQAYKGEIMWIAVKGMGQHWPGGRTILPESPVGKTSNKLDATDTIWDYFLIIIKDIIEQY